MSILFAGLLLSVWGLLVFSAPKRKRYRPRRRWAAGHSDIEGAESDSTSPDIEGDYVGDFGDAGGADAGGGDFGGDAGGGDCGGGDGGGCGGGD